MTWYRWDFCFYTGEQVFWVKKIFKWTGDDQILSFMDHTLLKECHKRFKPSKTDVKIHHFLLVQPVSLWGLTCLVKVGRQRFNLPVIIQWSRQIPKAQCIVFTITPICCSMCWRMTLIQAIFCLLWFLKRCIMTLALPHSASLLTAVIYLIHSALL